MMTDSEFARTTAKWPKREDVRSMTDIAVLWEAQQDMQEVADRIRGQLDQAKSAAAAGSEYSAPGWYRKAEQAHRIACRIISAMQFQMGELKRKRRFDDAQAFGQRFIDAAKATLDRDVFKKLMDAAGGREGVEGPEV